MSNWILTLYILLLNMKYRKKYVAVAYLLNKVWKDDSLVLFSTADLDAFELLCLSCFFAAK